MNVCGSKETSCDLFFSQGKKKKKKIKTSLFKRQMSL